MVGLHFVTPSWHQHPILLINIWYKNHETCDNREKQVSAVNNKPTWRASWWKRTENKSGCSVW